MSVNGSSPQAGSAAVLAPPGGEPTGRRIRPPAPAPVRARRRPGLLAAGIALIAVGALGAAYLTQVVGDTASVVAVARSVQPGEVIERGDLTVAAVNADPALSPVPAARLEELVGQRAAVALTPGSLLTAASVTEQVVPVSGQSLVGVALTRAQLPAEPLRAGDQVRIVSTPGNQGEPPVVTPTSTAGEVVSTAAPEDTDLTIVNVSVPSGQAADLAARVATGRVALVLDSRER